MDFFRSETHHLCEVHISESGVFKEDIISYDLAGVVEGPEDMTEQGVDCCCFCGGRCHARVTSQPVTKFKATVISIQTVRFATLAAQMST